MPRSTIAWVARIVRKSFYTFLDISGILLGVFLIALGWWMVADRPIPQGLGGIVLFLGISALIIHTGHYFHLGITRWMFGADGYFHKDDRT
jgi:hypothetical protein